MEPTLKAIRKSIYNFNRFSDVTIICPQYASVPHEFKEINAEFHHGDYSRFMLRELVKYVKYDYCLTIQWDSCIIDGAMWDNSFLDYDYIGAVWPNQWVNRVGNGGFSLRSYAFLDQAARLPYNKTEIVKEHDNEDYHACVTHYETMVNSGIKFSPINLARKFSVEHPIPESPHNYNNLSSYKSFAAHGVFNSALMKYIDEI